MNYFPHAVVLSLPALSALLPALDGQPPQKGIVAASVTMVDQSGGEHEFLMSLGHWMALEELAGGRVDGGTLSAVALPGCVVDGGPVRVSLTATDLDVHVAFDAPLIPWDCFVIIGWLE